MKVLKKLEISNSQKEYQTHEKPKRPNWRARCPLARAPDVLQGGPFWIFQQPLLQNIKKLKGHPLGIFFSKKLIMPKKLKGGPLGFFNIFSVTKHQKH